MNITLHKLFSRSMTDDNSWIVDLEAYVNAHCEQSGERTYALLEMGTQLALKGWYDRLTSGKFSTTAECKLFFVTHVVPWFSGNKYNVSDPYFGKTLRLIKEYHDIIIDVINAGDDGLRFTQAWYLYLACNFKV